jgi:hypothetical protein
MQVLGRIFENFCFSSLNYFFAVGRHVQVIELVTKWVDQEGAE